MRDDSTVMLDTHTHVSAQLLTGLLAEAVIESVGNVSKVEENTYIHGYSDIVKMSSVFSSVGLQRFVFLD